MEKEEKHKKLNTFYVILDDRYKYNLGIYFIYKLSNEV